MSATHDTDRFCVAVSPLVGDGGGICCCCLCVEDGVSGAGEAGAWGGTAAVAVASELHERKKFNDRQNSNFTPYHNLSFYLELLS